MQKYSSKKIGKATLTTPSVLPADHYSDKGAEDILLELFSGTHVEEKRDKILADSPSWPIFYHLTPTRSNLLGWYEFAQGSRVLEVGAGPGGVTQSIVNKDVNVTALELSPKRALINAHRNKKYENLEVIVGNLEDYTPEDKFDYVVVVGVLEYAGTFIHTDDPYSDFLKIIKKLLKPKGKLLLAIENRMGLKYWAGAKEDHIHTLFEGHNGYPNSTKMQTFGRVELSDMMIGSGFKSTYFYYPFPDYKSPSFVFSDDYYPGYGAEFPLKTLPTKTLDRGRDHFLSEQNLMLNLETNDMFKDFSNSFLVEASL